MCRLTTKSSSSSSSMDDTGVSNITTATITPHDDDNVDTKFENENNNNNNKTTTKQHDNHELDVSKGFLYGTISLAFVVTASTVMMGHAQSKRDQLGCDAVCVGTMTSARSTLMLVGSTIVGRSSDSKVLSNVLSSISLSSFLWGTKRRTDTNGNTTKIGDGSNGTVPGERGGARRSFLIVGIVASGIELLISSNTDTLTGLWISLIPSALLQQNFNVLKALFGEYHDESASAAERAGSVGKLGMAAGLAFMAGPLLSSVVFSTYQDAAIFASLCLVFALWFVILLPPPPSRRPTTKETTKTTTNTQNQPKPTTITMDKTALAKKTDMDVDEKENDDDNEAKSVQQQQQQQQQQPGQQWKWWDRLVPDLVPAARTPPALFIMSCRICMSLSFHIFQTIWAVALKERFRFGPKDYGRYYSFIGFGFAMSQGFLAKFVLKKFGNTNQGRTRLLLLCALILGGGRFLAYQTESIVVVYALFGLIIVSLGLINTIFTADTSKIASPDELGGLFGVLSSVESLAGIAGPIIGGILSKQFHPVWGPLGSVLLLYGAVFGMVYCRYEDVVMRATVKTEHGKGKIEKID